MVTCFAKEYGVLKMYYMDYEERLIDAVEKIAKNYPIFADINGTSSSISVATLPASTTIRKYYDGIVDKQYINELTVKAQASDRKLATKELAAVGAELAELKDIPSNNGSYDFGGIAVTNEMFFSEATTDGWIYFKLQIRSLLTIYKE